MTDLHSTVGLSKHFWIHQRLVRVNLWLTFALIALGGFVHNTGSSLACPDWPLCFGQFLPEMVGGVAIEHSHRLLASLVGFVNILIVFWAWRTRREAASLWWPSVLSLIVVIVQGLFGGATVLFQIHPALSTAHLALSQLYLGILMWLRVRSSYVAFPRRARIPQKYLDLTNLALALLFFQMVLGALIRHTGFAPACGLGTDAMILCRDLISNQVVWWPQFIEGKIHIIHRYLGVLLGVMIPVSTWGLLVWVRDNKEFAFLAKLTKRIYLILFAQILLGVATVASLIAIGPVTLHLIGAALLWLLLLALNFHLRCLRIES